MYSVYSLLLALALLLSTPWWLLEMLRHGIHDVERGPYSRGQQLVKMLKYVERSYYATSEATKKTGWNPWTGNDEPMARAAARIAAGEPCVWRLKVPEDRGEITFVDAVRGETSFPADTVDEALEARKIDVDNVRDGHADQTTDGVGLRGPAARRVLREEARGRRRRGQRVHVGGLSPVLDPNRRVRDGCDLIRRHRRHLCAAGVNHGSRDAIEQHLHAADGGGQLAGGRVRRGARRRGRSYARAEDGNQLAWGNRPGGVARGVCDALDRRQRRCRRRWLSDND